MSKRRINPPHCTRTRSNKTTPPLPRCKSSTDTTDDATAQLVIEKKIFDLNVQQADLQNKITAAEGHDSFTQNFATTIVNLQNQWGSFARQSASLFGSVFNSAISSISNGITGLIMGTKTWGRRSCRLVHRFWKTLSKALSRWVCGG